ncbi:MAG: DUF3244 domain-containing protein [Candidatus Nanoarchaeia archaeon]
MKNHSKVIVFLCFFTMLCVIQFSYAQFYQDRETEEFTTYVSTVEPTIDVSITSESNRVILFERVLYNQIEQNIDEVPFELEPKESRDFVLNIPNNEKIDLLSEDVDVEIVIESINSNNQQTSIELIGDPSSFTISYISPTQTQATSYETSSTSQNINSSEPITLSNTDEFLQIDFSEPIVEYIATVDEEELSAKTFDSNFKDEIPSLIELDTSNLGPGEYSLNLQYKDIAGNELEEEFTLNVLGPPLEITRIYTKRDSNEYDYYFNSRFPENNIYTSSKSFNIEFETNREANCYQERVNQFRETFNVEPVTTNTKEHSIPISEEDIVPEKNWIMCEEVNSTQSEPSRTYLSENMFDAQVLFGIVHLDEQSDFEITNFRPQGVVTSSPFTIEATTNYDSVCEYRFETKGDSYTPMDFESGNLLTHFKEGIISSNDSENLIGDVLCVDKLGNEDSTDVDIELDTVGGVQLVSWSPKLTFKEFVDVEIEVSDPSASCEIVTNSNPRETIEPSSNDLGVLTFEEVGQFQERKTYDLPLECVNSEGVNYNLKISIEYDPTSPTIRELNLFNENYGPTTYFSNSSYMDIEVDDSSNSVQYYVAELSNSQIIVNSTSLPLEIREDFSQDSSVSVYFVDEAGRQSNTIEESFTFDSTPPELSIQLGSSSSKRVIECSDDLSSCVNIQYGTSSIEESCNPRTPYNNDSEIDIFGKNIICAKALDEAGNSVSITEQVSSSTGGGFNENGTDIGENSSEEEPFDENDDQNESEEENTSGNESDGNPFEEPDPVEPVENEEEGFNWILLSAFGFLLLMVGTGGYYTYSRGYLDKQLIKMGITPKHSKSLSGRSTTNSASKTNNLYSPIPRKDITGSSDKSNTVNQPQKTYDSHIGKLNDFINSTLNKDKEMFDKFDKEKNPTASKKNNSLKKELFERKKTLDEEKKGFEEFYKDKAEKKDKEK